MFGGSHGHSHGPPVIDVNKLSQSKGTQDEQPVDSADLERPISSDSSLDESPVIDRDPSLSYVFVATISVHCIFSGFVMGVQTDPTIFISVFLSLAFHKWAESLAVGSSLAADETLSRLRWWILCAVPACASLVGILIGIGTTRVVEKLEMFIGVSSAISAGIFIFLGVVDILAPELLYGNRIWKSAFVIVGLLLALFFSLLFGDH